MLNKIIFIIGSDQSAYMQKIVKDIHSLGENLHDQISVSCIVANDCHDDILPDPNYSETLYIADNSAILSSLLDSGCYTIALRHEYNRFEDLSRALYVMEDIGDIEYDSFLKAYERLAGLPWHIADTARLILRETTIADVDDFYRIYQDPAITCYTEALYGNMEEERAYVKDYIDKVYGFYGYGIWTVLLRETKEVIGRAGISHRVGFDCPELGFVIAVCHQRKGYALEACQAVLEFAFHELQFNSVQALVHPQNKASISLCRKLDFQYTQSIPLNNTIHDLYIKTLT